MAKIITVTIDPTNGEVETELDGYQGKGCHAIQDVLTKALGGEVQVERRKPEYNKMPTNKVCITK